MYIRGYFEDNWCKFVVGGVSLYEKIIRDNKTITTIFAVSHSENNVVENVEAANNLVPIKDNSGNVVTYRNSSEPIMRLSEYNYPTQSLRAAWVSNFISSSRSGIKSFGSNV